MKRWTMTFLMGGLLALTLIGVAMAGPLEDAISAVQRGDYAAAMPLFRSLADQGDAVAQANLGVMYHYARGVPQDYAQALIWYRKAAKQGYAPAQSSIGRIVTQ